MSRGSGIREALPRLCASEGFRRIAVGCGLLLSPTIYFAPALFGARFQAFGENTNLGFPLFLFLGQALHGEHPMLWSDRAGGGYPLHAEGQGAFFHPLHLLLAWLFPDALGYGILQWANLLLSSVGAHLFCRQLGVGRWGSLLAATAFSFNEMRLDHAATLPVGETLAWFPWSLVAFQRLIAAPGWGAAAGLGATVALMVLSGYPQITHGAVIYLALLGLSEAISRARSGGFRRWIAPRLAFGAVAGLLGVGLSAVQWMPLLELVELSDRSEGIELASAGEAVAATGLWRSLAAGVAQVVTAPSSPWIGLLALVGIFRARALGLGCHVLPLAFLLFLGIGANTGVMEFVREHHLVPGLHFFRTASMYGFHRLLILAAIGVALLDHIGRRFAAAGGGSATAAPAEGKELERRVLGAGVAGALLLGALWLGIPSWVQIPLLIAALVLAKRWRHLLVPSLCAVLCLDLFVPQAGRGGFAETHWMAPPQSVRWIRSLPDYADYKHYDATWSVMHTLVHGPTAPELIPSFTNLLACLGPMTNLYYDIPSLRLVMTLKLQRQVLAQEAVLQEIQGERKNLAGRRLMDRLGVRYIHVYRGAPWPAGARFVDSHDPAVELLENPHAKPRFQVFGRARRASSPQNALELLARAPARVLVVESDEALPGSHRGRRGTPLPDFEVRRAEADHYEIHFDSHQGVWFFLADADYPGWQARVDGVEAEVYSADLLGKAVWLPPHSRRLELEFAPAPLQRGLLVSGASLALVAALSGRQAAPHAARRWRARRARSHTVP